MPRFSGFGRLLAKDGLQLGTGMGTENIYTYAFRRCLARQGPIEGQVPRSRAQRWQMGFEPPISRLLNTLTLFCCSRSSCSFICSSMARDSPWDKHTHTHLSFSDAITCNQVSQAQKCIQKEHTIKATQFWKAV